MIYVENKDLVIPGQVLADDEYYSGRGTFKENGKVCSSLMGLVSLRNKKIRVIPLKSKYVPKKGDVVIGKINDVRFSMWDVDINSPYSGILPAFEVFGREKKELNKVYDVGDVLFLRVVDVDEIKKAIRKGVKDGTIYPVYCGTGQENVGVMSLMDVIGKYLPNPNEITEIAHDSKTGEPVEVVQDAQDTTSAIVFKTIADPYVGKMSLFRVYSGSVKADSTLYNPNKDTTEKIGKLFTLTGKKQTDVKSVDAGDIGVVAKLDKTKTGDTLCAENKNIILSNRRGVKK